MTREKIVSKGFSLIGIAFLMIGVSSQIYNVNILCGTCSTTTGCLGNICLKVTGDISHENCYGQSTCSSYSHQTALTLSECRVDQSGGTCQSGICMSSFQTSMCLGNGNMITTCQDALITRMTCSNKKMSVNYQGGIYNQLYGQGGLTIDVPINYDCPFTSATMNYFSCSGDGMGNLCTCCYTSSFQGLVSSYGSCVPSSSPIVQIKSAMKGKYGLQYVLSSALILFQIILILI